MRRTLLILIAGLLLAVGGFCAIYFAKVSSKPRLPANTAPELAWLKTEFKLGDAEFNRIAALHSAYYPECQEMCRRIAQKNTELKTLLSKATTVTPEIEKALAEAAQMRAHCQKLMLNHFYEVAQAMPAPQRDRYLSWVQDHTLFFNHGIDTPGEVASSAQQSHSHH
jgi:hypothetical protein